MRYITILAVLFALFAVFAARDVRAGDPYVIEDATKPGEQIVFFWTKNGFPMVTEETVWKATWKCEGGEEGSIPEVKGGFKHKNDTTKNCKYAFTAPKGATDWVQTINGKNGATKTRAGNIKQDSPWVFEELALLPEIHTRIPDLAPIAEEGSELTIYSAVNLRLYMTENPEGFRGGNWQVGQTLSELGVEIVNGEVAGVQGMYWATTEFEFDPDPAGRGFTPVGGDANLLDSASYEHEIEILQQHIDPGPVGGTTELLVGDSDAPAESAGSSGDSTLPVAAAAGGLLIALAGGGWFIRRRLVG